MSVTRTNKANHQHPIAKQSIFLLLPDEVIAEIFKFARPELILGSFAFVCQQFFIVSQMDFLWQFKQSQHFLLFNIPAHSKKSDYFLSIQLHIKL